MTQRFGTLLLSIPILVGCCSSVHAASPVYKSVDAAGKVTYSSSPPPEQRDQQVEEVKLAPGPSQQEMEAADKRLQEIERAEFERNKKLEQEREERNKARESTDSELRRAEQDLEEAKIQRDSDWQTLQQGGRVLKQRYLDRVEAAEARVRKAQNAQRGSRR